MCTLATYAGWSQPDPVQALVHDGSSRRVFRHFEWLAVRRYVEIGTVKNGPNHLADGNATWVRRELWSCLVPTLRCRKSGIISWYDSPTVHTWILDSFSTKKHNPPWGPINPEACLHAPKQNSPALNLRRSVCSPIEVLSCWIDALYLINSAVYAV